MRLVVVEGVPRSLLTLEGVLYAVDRYLSYIEREYVEYETPCANGKPTVVTTKIQSYDLMRALDFILDAHPHGVDTYLFLSKKFYVKKFRNQLGLKRISWFHILICDATAYVSAHNLLPNDNDLEEIRKMLLKLKNIDFQSFAEQFMNRTNK